MTDQLCACASIAQKEIGALSKITFFSQKKSPQIIFLFQKFENPTDKWVDDEFDRQMDGDCSWKKGQTGKTPPILKLGSKLQQLLSCDLWSHFHQLLHCATTLILNPAVQKWNGQKVGPNINIKVRLVNV